MKLAGRLCGPWVAEAEHAWRSSTCRGQQIELDMRDLTGVDDAGRELLSAMHVAGVRLVVEGVWMKGLIAEITGNEPVDGARGLSLGKKITASQRPGCTGNGK